MTNPALPSKRRVLAEYLSRPQLAYELNKTIRSLQRWEQEHRGPSVPYVGNSPYYSAETVRAWLADQERRHAPMPPIAGPNGRGRG